MKKGSHLINKPIIAEDTGEELKELEGVAQSAGDRLQTTAQIKGERLQDEVEKIKAGVVRLWEKVKGRASDIADSSAEAWEQQQIKNALGRPVTRVIIDNEDRVILKVGDLITYQAIAEAKEADILDILLDSVHEETSELSSTKLRLPN